jgi:hypothetical protein
MYIFVEGSMLGLNSLTKFIWNISTQNETHTLYGYSTAME